MPGFFLSVPPVASASLSNSPQWHNLKSLESFTEPTMSHKHEILLRTISGGPLSGNVHWCEVESLLAHLGARLKPHHGANFRVVLNGAECLLHRPRNSNTCSKQAAPRMRPSDFDWREPVAVRGGRAVT